MLTQTISRELEDLVKVARHEPVTILTNSGERAAVLVSPDDYDRLDADLTLRREAGQRLIELMKVMGQEAVDKGLTEEELERLLADES